MVVKDFNKALLAILKDNKLSNHHVTICRQDGVSVFSNINDKDFITSTGALASSSWHASVAMASMFNGKIEDDCFRFSFDTTSQGIYMLALNTNYNKYIFSVIYSEVINPGLLKNRIRVARDFFVEAFNGEEVLPKNKNNGSGNFLFENISDTEIDKLFSL